MGSEFMLKIILISVFCFYTNISLAEIYKWTDENGQIHYGDKPLVDSKEMDIDISKQGHIKVNGTREEKRRKLLETYNDDKQREDKEKAKRKKQKKKQERGCVLSKDRMKRFQRARSLYDLDKDGNRVTMSNEQREKSINELRNKIIKYCK
ncbi:hypothetical protein MNBD_GAMMA08-1074 [hydrothermal vent metagenome]|uniref:DUF4124 domain-containing protein n=1 Tax=hydrothermal vent metagenome TaxID=652676 RepID=A0A3B0XGV2_9ZZZZ